MPEEKIKNVLVVGQIHEAALEILNDHKGLIIEVITDPGADIPVAKVEQADALLIRYGVLTEADIENAEHLRMVSRHQKYSAPSVLRNQRN